MKSAKGMVSLINLFIISHFIWRTSKLNNPYWLETKEFFFNSIEKNTVQNLYNHMAKWIPMSLFPSGILTKFYKE